ncbi:HAD family hydrolase [Synergistaceae bacterium OttesenSCG-928-I11]|nr:HAD family hydrolase [Synergistaceae bacterium OttesenSCG-928-I11]
MTAIKFFPPFLPNDCDCFIFDVDGVLIETGESFPATIRLCVEHEWTRIGGVCDAPGYSDERNTVLKQHGSFNDDYDIAWVLLNLSAARQDVTKKLSRALASPSALHEIVATCKGDCVSWLRAHFAETFPRDDVRALCEDFYFGNDEKSGTSAMETPLIDVNWKNLPLPAYIYTGRDLREWRAAQRVLDWLDFPDDRVVHRDSGMLKPSPAGLEYFCDRFGHRAPIFFGDTMSDKKASDAFGKSFFCAIGPLLAEEPCRFDSVRDAILQLTGRASDE